MKFDLSFEGWVGSTAAVMKPCLDPLPHAQMAEGKKKKNLCAASFCYCNPGEPLCVPCTQTQVFYTSFLEPTLPDREELVII